MQPAFQETRFLRLKLLLLDFLSLLAIFLPLTIVCIIFVFKSQAQGQERAFSASPIPAPSPSLNVMAQPVWKDQEISRIRFSPLNDKREKDDFETYKINENGFMSGEELLSLTSPMDFKAFSQFRSVFYSNPDELKKAYADYLKQISIQNVSILSFAKILDHEAMKRKIAVPAVSKARAQYVVRAILTQNGLSLEKFKMRELNANKKNTQNSNTEKSKKVLDEDISKRTLEEMYVWLLEVVKDQSVRFNMDWQFSEGPIHFELKSLLQSPTEPIYSPVSLHFEKLPKTVVEFEKQISEKLEPEMRRSIRLMVWQILVEEMNPYLNFRVQLAVNNQVKREFYEKFKDKFFKIQPIEAKVLNLKISGSRKEEFIKALTQKISENQNKLLEQIPTHLDSKTRMDKIKEFRKVLPAKIISDLKLEFQTQIQQGDLDLKEDELTLNHNGADDLPKDEEFSSRRLRAVMNPFFASFSVLPNTQVLDDQKNTHFMMLVSQEIGQNGYFELNDERVTRFLSSKIQERYLAQYYRETIYRLFLNNPVQFIRPLCLDKNWECIEPNATSLTESLVRESYFSGANKLPQVNGSDISSTLEYSQYWHLVESLSLENLAQAFGAPNFIQRKTTKLSSVRQ